MRNIDINTNLSENIHYNNASFPIYVRKGQLSNYPNYQAACHWHTDFELIYVYDGIMNYNINGTKITLTKGQGLFINSGCLHFGYSDTHTDCHFLCILLHPSLLSSNPYFYKTVFVPIITNRQISYIHLNPGCTWHQDILNQLLQIENLSGNTIDILEMIRHFILIIEDILKNMDTTSIQNSQPDSDMDALTAMIGFVQQNYETKISVTKLAQIGNCCKTKCNAIFQKHLHMTPALYLTHYRLEKSIDLLCHSSMSVTEIAYACGFSSSSYFCETFRKYYHITPNTYRTRRG